MNYNVKHKKVSFPRKKAGGCQMAAINRPVKCKNCNHENIMSIVMLPQAELYV